ncbi:MAG: potassium channel protein [Candidatus Zixiibacteriota bacterium]
MPGMNANHHFSAGKKLQLALLAFLTLLIAGTIGFMVIESMSPLNAVYMTVITLSTVGYGEVEALSSNGKLFDMVLILFGVALGGFVASVIGQVVIEGQFGEMVTRRKMNNMIQKMNEHCIVAGYGRVGRQVAQELALKKAPFVVIEKEPEALAQVKNAGYPFVTGDAAEEEVLKQAGIDRAKTLITTLPQEAQNVYLILTARYLNASLTIISRAEYEDGEKKLLRAGANHVVVPHVLGGTRMAMAALRPNVVDFMRMAIGGEEGLFVEEIRVPESSPFVGKSLSDSNLKRDYGVTIVGIRQGANRMVLNPASQTPIAGNDILVVMGQGSDLERLNKGLGV